MFARLNESVKYDLTCWHRGHEKSGWGAIASSVELLCGLEDPFAGSIMSEEDILQNRHEKIHNPVREKVKTFEPCNHVLQPQGYSVYILCYCCYFYVYYRWEDGEQEGGGEERIITKRQDLSETLLKTSFPRLFLIFLTMGGGRRRKKSKSSEKQVVRCVLCDIFCLSYKLHLLILHLIMHLG